jgi:hypothetical protein
MPHIVHLTHGKPTDMQPGDSRWTEIQGKLARIDGTLNCFMQPDTEAAKDFIAPALGQVRNLFNGERRPLATAADLMGRAFYDKTIITTRGDMPMALARRFAFQTMAQDSCRRPS